MANISRDTGPLQEWQLSEDEYKAITAIEQRLRIARDEPLEPDLTGLDRYLPRVQQRQPRVLLLDGGRGTGKTSLLLTLVERWRKGKDERGLGSRPEDEATDPQDRGELKKLPTHITAVGNLDFDPLPPGMPVVAGLIQAWRPLVQRFADLSRSSDESDESSLLDDWHSLFQMAATAWTSVPQARGFVDQVVEREEQVQDWLNFSRQWSCFINRVLKEGVSLKEPDRLPSETVFVIMIDDCDLQVSRISELLPALRLLYHPRVFFLVAADQPHMLKMLELDFLGQQNRLAGYRGYPLEATNYHEEALRWARSLAHSTFEKVFTKDNRWCLKRLSLMEFLAFPGRVPTALGSSRRKSETWHEESFYRTLNQVVPAAGTKSREGAGAVLEKFAGLADKQQLPGVTTFRAAQQLLQYSRDFPGFAPAHVLAGLFSLIGTNTASARRDEKHSVEVFLTGELMSLFQATLIEFAGYNVVLGTRPDFALVEAASGIPSKMSSDEHGQVNFTALLAAKLLDERGYPVGAAGLRWENHLSLAWTEWRDPKASFAWRRHKHPRPDQLLVQTQQWHEFISKPREEAFSLDRYAFAWIYFEREWNELPADKTLNPMNPDFPTRKLGPIEWKKLLDVFLSRDSHAAWRNTTLPMLARPEIGLPPGIQGRLLSNRDTSPSVAAALRDLRRRDVTSAIVASRAQQAQDVRATPTSNEVEQAVEQIDREYQAAYKRRSPWTLIEKTRIAAE